MIEKAFMRLDEFAEHCNVSERTVRAWIYARKIPYVQVKRIYLIDRVKALAALAKFEKKEISA